MEHGNKRILVNTLLTRGKIAEAIDFAKKNEYSGSKDLRIAILRGFSKEPYHKILGPTKKRGGPAGMILKNGYQIASWGSVERVDMTFSVTKSYLSTVAGLAVDRNLISPKEKVSKIIWDTTFDGNHNSQITWEHLLNQSSDWSGTLWGGHDWADRPPSKGSIDDWKNRAFSIPGTQFEYNDVRVNLLAYSLLNVWRKPLPQVLKEYIMDPIGASSSWRWYGYNNSWIELDGQRAQSVSGGGHSGGGLFINTLDHARFGLLFLNDGAWKGNRLISKNWIKDATTPSPAQAVVSTQSTTDGFITRALEISSNLLSPPDKTFAGWLLLLFNLSYFCKTLSASSWASLYFL